jgi:hypothetical protein
MPRIDEFSILVTFREEHVALFIGMSFCAKMSLHLARERMAGRERRLRSTALQDESKCAATATNQPFSTHDVVDGTLNRDDIPVKGNLGGIHRQKWWNRDGDTRRFWQGLARVARTKLPRATNAVDWRRASFISVAIKCLKLPY